MNTPHVPKPSSAGHNHHSVVDSSKSKDDQGHAHLNALMRINLNQPVDAGDGPINHRRPVANYSDINTDKGLAHHYVKIKHFGHPHNLNKYNIQQYSETNCKVCGLQVVGSGYGCQRCQFFLHESCFNLPQKIQHDAHTRHPLTLQYPSYYHHLGKACNACCIAITARSFLYRCDLCKFDLHVTCATLYSMAKIADTSKDALQIYYRFPFGDRNNIIARCNVCNKTVSNKGWLYYSKDTGHIAHIECAKDAKPVPPWIKERLDMRQIK